MAHKRQGGDRCKAYRKLHTGVKLAHGRAYIPRITRPINRMATLCGNTRSITTFASRLLQPGITSGFLPSPASASATTSRCAIAETDTRPARRGALGTPGRSPVVQSVHAGEAPRCRRACDVRLHSR
jgi:hypothetical protein